MDSYRDPNQQQQQQPLFQLNLDAQNSYYLRSSASWARILGVCGMIFAFLIAAYSVFILVALNNYEYGNNRLMDRLSSDKVGSVGNCIPVFLVGAMGRRIIG